MMGMVVEASDGHDTQSVTEYFDFEEHRKRAIDEYQEVERLYEDYAEAVYSILETALEHRGVPGIHSIESRAKTIESFGRKASEASHDDPAAPKYPKPLEDITDLAGVRVITFFLRTVDEVQSVVGEQFEVLERIDKAALLGAEKLGYQSVHYLVKLKGDRCALPEYARFVGLVAELQVRTILQHAWAEIEHDIQYKSVEILPREIRRRFTALAGVLEIADREFQAIQKEDQRLRDQARESVAKGRLERVEITADALKAYLDKRFGPDGRMKAWSYQWQARTLRQMGFVLMDQLDNCIREYDDDAISRLLHGNRQGQLTRFEDVLLAAMGEDYIRRHPWSDPGVPIGQWFVPRMQARLTRLESAGVAIGRCRSDGLRDQVNEAKHG